MILDESAKVLSQPTYDIARVKLGYSLTYIQLQTDRL